MINTTGKMYFKHKRLLLLVQTLLLFFVFMTKAQATETVNIVVDNFPPYVDQHEPPGVITKLVQQIFADKDIETASDVIKQISKNGIKEQVNILLKRKNKFI